MTYEDIRKEFFLNIRNHRAYCERLALRWTTPKGTQFTQFTQNPTAHARRRALDAHRQVQVAGKQGGRVRCWVQTGDRPIGSWCSLGQESGPPGLLGVFSRLFEHI